MTTYIVYSRTRQVCRTRDKARAEALAASIRGGYIVTIDRQPTAGEQLAMVA